MLTDGKQVVSGTNNTLWATSATQVVHFTTAGAQVAGSPYAIGTASQGIAAGPGNQVAFGNDAAYWITQPNPNNLRRFTPQGASTTLGGFPAAPTRGPRQITKGPNNTLWVTLAPNDAGQSDAAVARVSGVEPTPPPPPDDCTGFTLEGAKKNKKKGTAKQTVTVPCAGELALAGKKVKSVEETVAATAAGSIGAIEATLTVKPKKKAKKKLKKKGKAKVSYEVTYTPTGGEPNTQDAALTLKKKR